MRLSRPHWIAFIFAAPALLSLAPHPAWADGKPEKHVRVVQTFEPMRNNGTPMVQVRFSNTVIGTFLIDTGSFECVMTDAFAKRLGVKPSGNTPLGFLLGGPAFAFPYAQIPEIKLDNLTISGQRFRVIPQRELSFIGGRRIDGLLGADLLARFAMLIDYPNHEISWITPGGLEDAVVAELGFIPKDALVLNQSVYPIDNSKVNNYSTRVSLRSGAQSGSEELFVDTGSPHTIISYPLAHTLRLVPIRPDRVRTLFSAITEVSASRVPVLQAGNFAAADAPVLYPVEKNSHLPSLLGEDILSGCAALFDFGPHRLYLRSVLPLLAAASTPVDHSQVNWNRLRQAPDLPATEEMLATGFSPEAQDDLSARVAPERAAAVWTEPERWERLGARLRQGGNESEARTALAQAVTLAKAQAQAHPEDGERAQRWSTALVLDDHAEEAVASARQAVGRLPSSAPVWRGLGFALASHALRLLADPGWAVTEDEALDPYPAGAAPAHKPDAAQVRQAQAMLLKARGCFNRAVELAPQAPEGYQQRAAFWALDRGALLILRDQGFKPQTFPAETLLALCLADLQQCALLSPNDADRLRRTALMGLALPLFQDRKWLGNHLAGTGRPVPAVLATRQTAQARLLTLAQDPDRVVAAPALAALGEVQQAQDDPQAEDSWRHALAVDPGRADALGALAQRLHRDGRWLDLRDLLARQALLKDTVPLRLTLAAVLNALDNADGAEAQVRSALKLDPASGAANLTLAGLLLARVGADNVALAEALSCLDRADASAGVGALATPEQRATLATTRAVWLALTGDLAAARKQLVTLAKDQPTCTQAREALAAMTP